MAAIPTSVPRLSLAVASHLPSRVQILNTTAVAVWAAGFLDIVCGGALPASIGITACTTYVLISLPVVNRGSIAPIVLALVGLIAFSLPMMTLEPTLAGLSFGTRLGAFLFSALLLRQTLMGTVSLARAQDRFAAMPLVDQKGAALLISFGFGVIFTMTTYTLLSPLMRDHTPEERRAFGPIVLCGACLAAMWSPFSIATAYSIRMVPVESVGLALAWCCGLAVLGVAFALALYSRFRWTVVAGAMAAVAPVTLPLMTFSAAIAATCLLADIKVSDAVIVVTPFVCLAFLALRRGASGGHGIATVLRDTHGRSGKTLSDLLLFAIGLAFALAVEQSGILAQSLSDLAGFWSPDGILIALALLLPVACLSGLHGSILAGIVVIAALSVVGAGSLTAVFVLSMLAWAGTTLLSFSSVSVSFVHTEFGGTFRSTILGRNIVVLLAVGVAAAGAIATGLL